MKVCILLLLSFFLVDAMDERDMMKDAILKDGLKTFEELNKFHFKLCMLRWGLFNNEEMAICENIWYQRRFYGLIHNFFSFMKIIFRTLLHSDELATWIDGVKNGFSRIGDRCDCKAPDCHPCNAGCEDENSPKCDEYRVRYCLCRAAWCNCASFCPASDFGSERCKRFQIFGK